MLKARIKLSLFASLGPNAHLYPFTIMPYILPEGAARRQGPARAFSASAKALAPSSPSEFWVKFSVCRLVLTCRGPLNTLQVVKLPRGELPATSFRRVKRSPFRSITRELSDCASAKKSHLLSSTSKKGENKNSTWPWMIYFRSPLLYVEGVSLFRFFFFITCKISAGLL